MLNGLRTVDDETLYLRLAIHRQRIPPADPPEDYYIRADLWEIVNKALREEIARRKAPPPSWWPQRKPRPRPVLTTRRGILIATYLALLVVVGAAGLAIERW